MKNATASIWSHAEVWCKLFEGVWHWTHSGSATCNTTFQYHHHPRTCQSWIYSHVTPQTHFFMQISHSLR